MSEQPPTLDSSVFTFVGGCGLGIALTYGAMWCVFSATDGHDTHYVVVIFGGISSVTSLALFILMFRRSRLFNQGLLLGFAVSGLLMGLCFNALSNI